MEHHPFIPISQHIPTYPNTSQHIPTTHGFPSGISSKLIVGCGTPIGKTHGFSPGPSPSRQLPSNRPPCVPQWPEMPQDIHFSLKNILKKIWEVKAMHACMYVCLFLYIYMIIYDPLSLSVYIYICIHNDIYTIL